MINTLREPLDMCISKYTYSVSLLISFITAILLKLNNISYINITLFAVLIFCISLMYLSRNKVIEGIDAMDDMMDTKKEYDSYLNTTNELASKVKGDIFNVLETNGIDAKALISQDSITELTKIIQSISDPSETPKKNINGPIIDTTSKTKNNKLLDAHKYIYNINNVISCDILTENQCVAADDCIWVNRKSNTGGNISLCERGDKSGPYPKRNPDGSLSDVDYDYYKIK